MMRSLTDNLKDLPENMTFKDLLENHDISVSLNVMVLKEVHKFIS